MTEPTNLADRGEYRQAAGCLPRDNAPSAGHPVVAMSDVLEGRERLESAHKQLQDAMTQLITKKNYSEAERLLLIVDQLMLDLIEDMGAPVVRPSVWT